MEFISELGFDVKRGKSREFQEWVRKNEDILHKEAPPGWEYIGTYSAVLSSEKEAGQFRQLWRHDSYGAWDRFAAAMKEDTPFARLMDEFGRAFQDDEKGAHWSQSIYKSVVDTSIWGEE